MATAEEVQGLYTSLIGRTGTPDEVAYWVAQNRPASQLQIDFINARNDAAQVARAADIVKSGASNVVNPTTWGQVLAGVGAANTATGGLLGTGTTTGTTTGGLLGGTGTTPVKVTAADITNLYKNVIGATPEAAGMEYWLGKANAGMSLATMESEIRKAMNDPAAIAKRAALIKAGESTSIPGTSAPSGFAGFQSGIREVPFGGTVVGGNVTGPGAGYTQAMYAPSIQDAFLQSMLYQSQLPNRLPVFNPAATPSIFPQIAQALGRYNIAGAEVPAWLRVNTPEEAKALAGGKTTTTTPATTTTVSGE